LTTNVTTSPAWRRRISSATAPSAARSRPRTSARPSASSTEISWPSSARPSARRTWGEAHASRNSLLPASPVLMALLDEARSVDERADAGPQRFGDEFGPPRELGIDGEALAKVEALALGGATEIGDERPGPLGIDVIEGQGRDAAPVVEPRSQEPRIDVGREIRRRLDIDLRPEDEPRHRQRSHEILERGLRRLAHADRRLGSEVL